MIHKFGVDLPTAEDLPALPRGVVWHWTAGSHKANATDLNAYHLVVEGDGEVKVGKHSVADNMRPVSGSDYAQHVGGWNSYRVGIAGAGMAGYTGPGNVGKYPLTEVQIVRMVELTVHFLEIAKLNPLNPLHACTHLEVWTLHSIKGQRNHQKLDIEHLPFQPNLRRDEVGPFLRELAARMMFVPIPGINPNVAVEQLDVPDADRTPDNLKMIYRPVPEHVDYVIESRTGFTADQVEMGMVVGEVIARAVARGGQGTVKQLADAFADWIKRRRKARENP